MREEIETYMTLDEKKQVTLNDYIHIMCNDICKGHLAIEKTKNEIDCGNCPVNNIIDKLEGWEE